jgi:KipI family sensor histidine kinase inhibitor
VPTTNRQSARLAQLPVTSDSANFSLQPLGQSTLLITLRQRIDSTISDRVFQIEALINESVSDLVEFTIPAYCSLAVGFDSQQTDHQSLARRLTRLMNELGDTPMIFRSTDWLIPVCYCDQCGPDLAEVANRSKLTIDELIRRHSQVEYRSYMLGFLPGFAYLGNVDASIAAPRKSTPRLRVPAGSVGLADQQTGIYPFESPGGWQVIGRTPDRMTASNQEQFFRVAPGDCVQFRPIDHAEFERLSASSVDATPNASSLLRLRPEEAPSVMEFLRSGFQTTIQDLGRTRFRRFGVPVAGAMDRIAAANANRLLGLPDHAAVLEYALVGPDIRFHSRCQIALTGARFQPFLNGSTTEMGQVMDIAAGDYLQVGTADQGCRGYLAINGKISASRWLQSSSASAVNEVEWTPGATIQAGDTLTFEPPTARPSRPMLPSFEITGAPTIRLLPGPEYDWLDDRQKATLTQSTLTVASEANRMGYRISESLGAIAKSSLISSPVVPGTVQLPSDGRPIVLMRDGQTTGGYPRIAVVLDYDLNRLAQVRPGNPVRFRMVSQVDSV